MDWKEFFRPTWQKILVFMILFPLLYFVQSLLALYSLETRASFFVPDVLGIVIDPVNSILNLIPMPGLSEATFVGRTITISFFLTIAAVLGGFYRYTAASFLVWLYARFKTKQAKGQRRAKK